MPQSDLPFAEKPVLTGKEFLNSYLAEEYAWEDLTVIYPLTTGLRVKSKADAIGFIVGRLTDLDLIWIIIEGRDWEASAAYTGMTANWYEQNKIPEADAVDLLKMLTNPSIAFANTIAKDALEMLGVGVEILPLRNVVLHVVNEKALADRKLATGELLPGDMSFHSLLDILLTKRVPNISRDGLLSYFGDDIDLPASHPAGEQMLAKDLFVWDKALFSGKCDEIPF